MSEHSEPSCQLSGKKILSVTSHQHTEADVSLWTEPVSEPSDQLQQDSGSGLLLSCDVMNQHHVTGCTKP